MITKLRLSVTLYKTGVFSEQQPYQGLHFVLRNQMYINYFGSCQHFSAFFPEHLRYSKRMEVSPITLMDKGNQKTG